mgnify:CR=1 FL=1
MRKVFQVIALVVVLSLASMVAFAGSGQKMDDAKEKAESSMTTTGSNAAEEVKPEVDAAAKGAERAVDAARQGATSATRQSVGAKSTTP